MAANPIKWAGKEAREKFGLWYSVRFLFFRRVMQLTILGMFLSGPYWGIWILKGNYTGSLLFDVVPLSDPLIILESLSTGFLPDITAILGALLVVFFYAV